MGSAPLPRSHYHTSPADKRRRNFQWITVIGGVIVLAVLMFTIVSPFEGGGNDAGIPFDDEPAVAQPQNEHVDDHMVELIANQAYEDSPTICVDMVYMDAQAAKALIVGIFAAEDIDIDMRQAGIVYDVFAERCSS